jgi:protein SCO1/2
MAVGFLKRRAPAHSPLVFLIALLTGAMGWLGCEQAPGAPGRYAAHGIVEDVDHELSQILIDHEDVAGLMPAMTMNFAVPDPVLLAKLAPGQIIDFEIHFTGRSYDVVRAEVVGEVSEDAGWSRLRDGLVRTSVAPAFDLIDQIGNAASLESFGDRVLMVDFIYTSCPGPCPVQTSLQVALQRRIPEALRPHVHFISISLDPKVDRPEVLARYAAERGADFSNWSFLTGPTDVVAQVVRSWGIGSIRQPNGTIDHTLVRFLVQNARVIQRYWTSDGTDETILQDLISLAEIRAAGYGSQIRIHP